MGLYQTFRHFCGMAARRVCQFVQIRQTAHMPGGRPRTTGSRLALPEPLNSDFLDFCEAHRGAPAQRIVADALEWFIKDRLDTEPELKKRFDQARRKRLGIPDQNDGNVVVLPSSK
jgi:hypothetical protein